MTLPISAINQSMNQVDLLCRHSRDSSAPAQPQKAALSPCGQQCPGSIRRQWHLQSGWAAQHVPGTSVGHHTRPGSDCQIFLWSEGSDLCPYKASATTALLQECGGNIKPGHSLSLNPPVLGGYKVYFSPTTFHSFMLNGHCWRLK